jgi:hypothetical protein
MSLAVACASIFVSLAASIWLLIVLPRHARGKGYGSPLIGVGLWSGWLLTAAAFTLWVFLKSTFRSSWFLLAVPELAVVLVAARVVRQLPARSVRHAGPRSLKFPYRTVGVVLMAAAFLLPVVLAFSGNFMIGLRLTTSLFAIGSASLWIGMRGAQTTTPAAGPADPRPEVLYIRAFQEEEEMFAEVLRKQKQFYTPSERTSFLLDERFPTFEDYFYEDLNRTLGPLAALGNPTDFVPPNILAKRDYYEDADWQDSFRQRAADAACILALPGLSPGLFLEFAYLLKTSLHRKLIVLTRPEIAPKPKTKGEKVRRWLTIAATARSSPRRAKWPKPVAWSSFAAQLNELGYAVSTGDPGPGAVIGFDPAGKSVMVRERARTSMEYITAMQDWLANGR